MKTTPLDVHKEIGVACVRIVQGTQVQHLVRTFGTTTARLLQLAEFLSEHGVTLMALEATGIYWRPVYHILEPQGFELVLGNAAQIKLTSVVTDVMGKTGRAIVEALCQGQTDPEALSQLACGSLRKKKAALSEALRGRVTAHHQYLLKLHLGLYDAVQRAIASLDSQLEDQMRPFRQAQELVITVPGIQQRVAQVILSEVGSDMSRFPTARHLLSWAGLCPRQDESAGKKRSTRIRKGAPWLKTTLVQAAWAAVRVKDSYYRSLYNSIKNRCGSKQKAIIAVAASMLTAVYFMLKRGEPYKELGPDYRDRRDKVRTAARLIRRVKALGFQIQLVPQAA